MPPMTRYAWPEQGSEQRLRMRRLALAAVGSSVTVCMTLAVAYVGYLPYKAVAIYAALVATLGVGFYAIIRSGLNLRFADPTLTVAQLIAAELRSPMSSTKAAMHAPPFWRCTSWRTCSLSLP